MPTLPWKKARPAPVVLVIGSEEYLATRAIAAIKTKVVAAGDVDVCTVTAATYTTGQLTELASPSLFSTHKFVLVEGAEKATDAFIDDALQYVKAPEPDVVLVIAHGGGNRGKKLLTAIKKHPDCVTVECPALRKDADKVGFVAGEFRAAKRAVSEDAVRALINAVGTDIRELAGACTQLIDDVEPGVTVEAQHVFQYHGGKVEATGFQVADACVQKNTDEALALVRQAVGAGLNPVPMVAALAMRFRTLILVASYRGPSAAKDLGMAPWQVDRAKREARRWQPAELAAAMVACADADEGVKGGSKDPVYALEKLVLQLTRH